MRLALVAPLVIIWTVPAVAREDPIMPSQPPTAAPAKNYNAISSVKSAAHQQPKPTYYPQQGIEQSYAHDLKVGAARKVAGSRSLEWDVPFLRLPEITSVPVAGDRFAVGLLDNEDRPTPLARFTFDRPANFPIPGFDLEGCPADQPGIVIYEGMRVTFREKGEYDVLMTVTIPDRPVTLRMQIELELSATAPGLGGHDRGAPPIKYTLTLPPIELNPVQRTIDLDLGPPPLRNTSRLSFHINHEGYSSLIDDLTEEICSGRGKVEHTHEVLTKSLNVHRRGTARFGTTPPRLFDR